MIHWSMTRRLVVTLTWIIGAFWIIGVAGSAYMMRHEIDEVFDSALQETAQRILPLVVDDLQRRREHDSDRLPDHSSGDHEEYIHYQVRDRSGRVVLRSHDAPDMPFAAPLQKGFFDDGARRFYTEWSADETTAVQVAELPQERAEAIQALWIGLLTPLLAVLPLAALAIRATVKRITEPVRRLRDELKSRDGINLTPLDGDGLPSELEPVASDVNRLLIRLRAALEAERAFASNSAHELRNPIAAAQAQAGLLADMAEDAEQRRRADGIVGTLATLGRRIETLLQLARAESGLALSRERMSLTELVTLLMAEYARKPHLQKRFVFENLAAEEVFITGDADALGIAIQNLVDNALKYSPAGSPVNVRFGPGPVLTVKNEGLVIAAEELGCLKQRFVRGAGGAEDGSGLGLYIADTIVHQSNGQLELYSPARGQPSGFEAVLRLSIAER